jgi:hypothetical protein
VGQLPRELVSSIPLGAIDDPADAADHHQEHAVEQLIRVRQDLEELVATLLGQSGSGLDVLPDTLKRVEEFRDADGLDCDSRAAPQMTRFGNFS